MSWIKFTSFETGKTYDSREPVGHARITDMENKTIDSEPVFKYPYGNENWIDDSKLADALGCSVDEISEKLKEFIGG